ncbi:putative ABC transporter permease [Lactococcus garvieae]|uniref:putative ABC transporter permease n=1 Tax=Lactococcus garvieae TaxID=1363 RepID=UPI003D6FDFFF
MNINFNIIVIVTIIEYITSFLLEKLFHMELWDYSNIPLNIEGRVDVFVSLFWE